MRRKAYSFEIDWTIYFSLVFIICFSAFRLHIFSDAELEYTKKCRFYLASQNVTKYFTKATQYCVYLLRTIVSNTWYWNKNDYRVQELNIEQIFFSSNTRILKVTKINILIDRMYTNLNMYFRIGIRTSSGHCFLFESHAKIKK